jgi:hypothetical protein
VLSAGDDRLPEHALDSYEIYKPPYFFRGDRPVLSSAPASSSWGRTIWVGTPDTDIARAVLVSPSATTHAVEMHQRVINLPAPKRADGAGYDVDMPVNANIALPGHHMLFLLDTQGRPSHARWIELRADAPVQAPPSPATPTRPDTTRDTRDPRVGAALRTRRVAVVRREKRVRLRVTLNERGRVSFRAALSRERSTRSRKRVTLGRWSRSMRFAQAGRRDTRLVLSDRSVRRLRGAADARLRIRIAASDASGNRTARTMRLRLRR